MDKKILTISIVFVLLASIGFFGCGNKEEAEPTPTETEVSVNANLPASNLANVDSTTIDTIVQQNYNLAKVKAQEWQPDAKLYSLSVKFPSDLAVQASDETFIFGSDNDKNNWWSFSISESTQRYIRALIPKEDYLGTDIEPINMSYWKSNYGQAFQLAEANGGLAFREANPSCTITATLHQTQPRGWLWWEIEYKSGSNSLDIKVNPSDGSVVDESGNPLSGSTSTNNTTPANTTTPTTTATATPNVNY